MSQFSDYAENLVGNALLRATGFTAPTTIYLGLFTVAPTDAGPGSGEVSGNNYARQVIAFSAPSTPGVFPNSGVVQFPAATPAGWGTVTHAALFDAATAGNMLIWLALDSSKAVGAGDVATWGVGQLEVDIQ